MQLLEIIDDWVWWNAPDSKRNYSIIMKLTIFQFIPLIQQQFAHGKNLAFITEWHVVVTFSLYCHCHSNSYEQSKIRGRTQVHKFIMFFLTQVHEALSIFQTLVKARVYNITPRRSITIINKTFAGQNWDV